MNECIKMKILECHMCHNFYNDSRLFNFKSLKTIHEFYSFQTLCLLSIVHSSCSKYEERLQEEIGKPTKQFLLQRSVKDTYLFSLRLLKIHELYEHNSPHRDQH